MNVTNSQVPQMVFLAGAAVMLVVEVVVAAFVVDVDAGVAVVAGALAAVVVAEDAGAVPPWGGP